MYNNYNPYGQQYPYQQQYIPLTFVNGIEGAKAYIVAPNQTVYLRDSDSDIIFIKSADPQGRYMLKAYNMVPVEKQETPVYATVDALKDLENRLTKLIGGTTNE